MISIILFSIFSHAGGSWVSVSDISKANLNQPYTVDKTKWNCVSRTSEKCFDVLKCPVDECRVINGALIKDDSMVSAKVQKETERLEKEQIKKNFEISKKTEYCLQFMESPDEYEKCKSALGIEL